MTDDFKPVFLSQFKKMAEEAFEKAGRQPDPKKLGPWAEHTWALIAKFGDRFSEINLDAYYEAIVVYRHKGIVFGAILADDDNPSSYLFVDLRDDIPSEIVHNVEEFSEAICSHMRD